MNRSVTKILLPSEILSKMQSWCAYQERSQFDALQKLFKMGVEKETAEEIIAQLISENFISEERYAIAFAGGKFRIKKWGKEKIRNELRKHKIPESIITTTLARLDPTLYDDELDKLVSKKIKSLKGLGRDKMYLKTFGYLVGKGYEAALIKDKLKQAIGETDYES